MLDEFSSAKLDDKTTNAAPTTPITSPSSLGPGRPQPKSIDHEETSPEEEAFARQLQAGMADMLKELEQNPDMAKQFEEMMAQFGAPPLAQQKEDVVPATVATPKATTKGSTAPPSASTSAPQADKDFQSTIRKTMERMKASSDSA